MSVTETNYSDDSDNAVGNQKYTPGAMATDAETIYHRLTGFADLTIIPKATESDLSLKEMQSGIRTRVILVRYNGYVKEIDPEEFEEFKDKLPKGIYEPVSFFWALSDQDGVERDVYNTDQANKAIKAIDTGLQSYVRSFFSDELPGVYTSSTKKLSVDIDTYITPLNE